MPSNHFAGADRECCAICSFGCRMEAGDQPEVVRTRQLSSKPLGSLKEWIFDK